jgi:Zn-dependent metalloprotease
MNNFQNTKVKKMLIHSCCAAHKMNLPFYRNAVKKATKSLVLFILVVLCPLISWSQSYTNAEAEKYVKGAELVRFKESSGFPVYIKFKEDFKLTSADEALVYTKQLLQLEQIGFVFKDSLKIADSESQYRYVQTIVGYPVEFSAWNVLLYKGQVRSIHGELSIKQPLTVDFSISEEVALKAALQHIGAELYMWQDEQEEQHLKLFEENDAASYYPKGEKVIVPDKIYFEKSQLRAAYKFNIYAKKPYDRKMVYVDAQTGNILFDLPLLHFDKDTTGIAHTQYSGIQTINTQQLTSTGLFILNDNTRGNGIKTLNCQNTTSYTSAVNFTDSDNVWNNVNANLDQYATDAHFATMKTYDYYLNVHGRNSINGYGRMLWSYIHFNLVATGNYSTNENAFWNGNCMTYGDGGTNTHPFTTMDICGHEITHGLTQETAQLLYENESGALNEAFSDIFGVAIEFYADPATANWVMGEKIGRIIRSMENPKAYSNPDTYQGTYWVTDPTIDNGGVHTNSGPMYYWFYLLCKGKSGNNDLGHAYHVDSIGMAKAEKIAFRLLTVYLTYQSQYSDAYFYGMQATADLYGACSPECQAVKNAFYAIGVAPDTNNRVVADFYTTITESSAAPFSALFTNTSSNASTFNWDFGDGTTSTLQNPTHVYQSYGQFTVRLIANSAICGIDTVVKTNYIVIDTALPFITIMPTQGAITINSCSGIIYDAGGIGIYPNLSDASITIHAAGASSILLNITEFAIEAGSGSTCDFDYIAFYDGATASSPLINNTYYCNTTGNPGQISSTGEYITIVFHSDQYLNLEGFTIAYYCRGANFPPTPRIAANKVYSCDGLIAFIDSSLNNPTAWSWDFGDGTTSTLQNPVHQYAANGNYTIRLTASNQYGAQSLLKTKYVTIDMPVVSDNKTVFACNDMPFEIQLDLDSSLCWYKNINDTAVYVGNRWIHPPVLGNETYYVRKLFPSQNYQIGPTNNTSGGGIFGNTLYVHYLVFDAYTAFTLKSVSVNAQGSGVRNIALRNASGVILETKSINIPNGVSRITLNMNVPAGSNLQLVGLGAPNLYRTSDGSLHYPYIIQDVVSINRSSASGTETDYYYYFYDWAIETPSCKSAFSTVELLAVPCNNPDIPIADFSADNICSCNTRDVQFTDLSTHVPAAWRWDFGDGTTSSLQHPLHHYTANGNYAVQLAVFNQNGGDTLVKANYIRIEIPEIAAIPDIVACNDRDFEINLELNGEAQWYNNTTDAIAVHTGNQWTHPAVLANKIYYIREFFQGQDSCLSGFTELRLVSTPCLGIASAPNGIEAVWLAPNPTNGVFTIYGLTEFSGYSISITDMLGQLLIEMPLHTNTIDMTPYAAGIYFVKLYSATNQKLTKIVKQTK